MKSTFLIISGVLIFCAPAFPQGKVEADIGVGLFEALSLKVKFGGNIQVGVCQGFFDKRYWLTGIEGYYYFKGESKYSDRPPVYLMAGLASTIYAYGYDRFEKIVFYPRIGKAFSFSPRTGINLDIGLGLIIAEDGAGGYNVLPFPNGGIHFFLRL